MGEARIFLGATPDQRRERRREALVESAFDLLQEGGLVAVGVRSVSQRASLNTRYFYESFASVDDLLIFMLQGLFADVLARGMSALREGGLTDVQKASDDDILTQFRHGLRVALTVALDDPRKLALLTAANASVGRVRQEMRAMVLRLADVIAGYAGAKEIGIDKATALFIAGGIVEVALAHVAGDLSVARKELIERMARITLGAINGSRAGIKKRAKKRP